MSRRKIINAKCRISRLERIYGYVTKTQQNNYGQYKESRRYQRDLRKAN